MVAGSERRKSPRDKYEIKQGVLYYKGERLPLPQAAIRATILDRLERGLWVPEFPAPSTVKLGDDVADEMLGKRRTSKD